MLGKSRHGKRKHSFRDKTKKSRPYGSVATSQQPVAAQAVEPAAAPKPSAPPVSMPTPTAKTKTKTITARYPYIIAELRRFGILAGIMLVVLIVLALVIS